MARYGYSSGYNGEAQARAVGRDLDVSVKHAVNVCNMVRLKPVSVAKKMLEEVIGLKRNVPYRRYKRDLAHKKGNMAAGRMPVKVSKEILVVIKSAEMNAVNKGLNATQLVVSSISAHKAANQHHYGRHRGRLMKRGHIEVVVEEAKGVDKKKDKVADKKETKPEGEKAQEQKVQKPVKETLSQEKKPVAKSEKPAQKAKDEEGKEDKAPKAAEKKAADTQKKSGDDKK